MLCTNIGNGEPGRIISGQVAETGLWQASAALLMADLP